MQFCVLSASSQPEAGQVDGEREQPWAPSESGARNGPRLNEEGEGEEDGPPNEVNGGAKGSRWMWRTEQRRLRGEPLGEDEEEEEEENNNSSSQQEEEEGEERTEGGEEQGREEREEGEDEEDEDEEEMDQDSDDFEHSESGREEDEEEEGEGRLRSPSLRNNVSAPSNNLDSGCTHQSSSTKKVSTLMVCLMVSSTKIRSCQQLVIYSNICS